MKTQSLMLGLSLALSLNLAVSAQDLAMSGQPVIPSVLSASETETNVTSETTFSYTVYGEIPTAQTAFEEEHFLGGSLNSRWNTFLANYTHEYKVEVGLSHSGTEIIKPRIYHAVMRANKYVKKSLKKKSMSSEEAILALTHILDCANVICFEEGTTALEEAAQEAKTGEEVLALFQKVKLVRM